jgi:hypothetical protein
MQNSTDKFNHPLLPPPKDTLNQQMPQYINYASAFVFLQKKKLEEEVTTPTRF